ncbi:NUDIX domain-containing protein [Actinomyces sp.]|uniref:NUDIX hydrolase n=1 Tax=Actinomyces sp. TaxID=29317 RepID=UPI002899BE16|nr:NUDIX domain-containing protein [Actinomyces sp.]
MSRSKPSPIPSRLVRAAGSLVWRFRDHSRTPVPGEPVDAAEIEVLLVHRPRYGDWSWPKGKTELNEPVPVAAVREVEEETGVAVALGAPLTTQRYRLGAGHTKEVHYWVGRALGPGPALRTRRPVEAASRREIDSSRWMTPSRAHSQITRRGDRRLLSELVARAESGTLVTSTVTLLRHSKAVSRSSWHGEEGTRVLTRLGVRQSIDLVELLSAFGTTELISSPWTRCRATIGPYASLAGIKPQLVDALTEEAARRDPDAALAVVTDLISRPHEPTVLCVHRPTLPLLMAPLQDATPTQLKGGYPTESPWLATSEALMVHVAHTGEPQVIGVETHSTYTKLLVPC